MDEEDQKIGNESDEREAGNARLRLPGFVNDEDMGLGDVLKQVTSAVGIKYRYLSRQMCYVLTVQGVETYILQPDDPADFGLLLVEALRPSLDTADVRFDVVIGVR